MRWSNKDQEILETGMTEKRRVAVVFVLGLALGIGMTIYSSVFAGNEKTAAASPLPLEDLRAFTEVFGRVKSDYVVSKFQWKTVL